MVLLDTIPHSHLSMWEDSIKCLIDCWKKFVSQSLLKGVLWLEVSKSFKAKWSLYPKYQPTPSLPHGLRFLQFRFRPPMLSLCCLLTELGGTACAEGLHVVGWRFHLGRCRSDFCQGERKVPWGRHADDMLTGWRVDELMGWDMGKSWGEVAGGRQPMNKVCWHMDILWLRLSCISCFGFLDGLRLFDWIVFELWCNPIYTPLY